MPVSGILTRNGTTAVGGGSGGSSTSGGQISSTTFTNGEAVTTIAYGEVCYISGNSTVKRAKNNGTLAQATARAICVQIGGVAAGATGAFKILASVQGLVGGTAGVTGYLGTNADITTTPPVTSGTYSVDLGNYLDTTIFDFVPKYPIQVF